MNKWITGIIGVLIFLGFQVVKVAEKEKTKQERREKYLAGYYDNMSVKSSLLGTKLEVNPEPGFIPPKNWNSYIISNSFSISVPNTVELRKIDDAYTQMVKDREWYGMKIDLNNVVFQQKGLATNQPEAYNTYCRIMIAVEKGNSGDYLSSTDYEDLDAETIQTFRNLASQNIGGYKIIGKPNVRWIKIENIYALKVDYVRTGSEGHRTCVSTYYFFNDDRMAQLTLSYRESDADKWKTDFENVIRTFKWRNKRNN